MVPHHPRRLGVGVVVVFELARLGEIFGPSVKRSARGRAVKMDRIWARSIVDEAYYCFCPLRDEKGWPRRDSVISDQSRRRKRRVDLLLKGLDLYLVI